MFENTSNIFGKKNKSNVKDIKKLKYLFRKIRIHFIQGLDIKKFQILSPLVVTVSFFYAKENLIHCHKSKILVKIFEKMCFI